ncbi:hypothetical protein ABIE56_000943 [Luteibacter sp. 621]
MLGGGHMTLLYGSRGLKAAGTTVLPLSQEASVVRPNQEAEDQAAHDVYANEGGAMADVPMRDSD